MAGGACFGLQKPFPSVRSGPSQAFINSNFLQEIYPRLVCAVWEEQNSILSDTVLIDPLVSAALRGRILVQRRWKKMALFWLELAGLDWTARRWRRMFWSPAAVS